MELVHGISTHFIQSKKFKTNKITVRFTAPLSLDTIAGRMLSASMLETANQMYPTSQDLRRHLASLYGTDMSTNCFRRGQSHIVELTFTYVRDEFLSTNRFFGLYLSTSKFTTDYKEFFLNFR